MEGLNIGEILTEVLERKAQCSATDGTPDGAEPVSVTLHWLEWADNMDDRRIPTLAKLCSIKPEIDLLCSTCKEEGASRCGAYGVRYCSTNCQKQDWKRHKLACKAFSKWDYSTRPSEDHFLALLFPTDRDGPELLWCRLTDNATKLEAAHPDIHRLSHREPRGHAVQINASLSLGRTYLGHGLALLDVYGLAEIKKDGLLNVNQCVSGLSTPGALAFHSGPQVVFAFEANDAAEPSKGIDVVPRDWRHATDYILLHKHNPSLPVTGVRPAQMSTRLNNLNSILVNRIHRIEKPIENVIAPISFFPRGGPCSAAFQLGLPWRVRCILGSEHETFSDDMKYLAPYLHRRPQPGSSGAFEWTCSSRYNCGSIIIMAVGKDRIVHRHHVKALNKYLHYTLRRCTVPSKKDFMKYWDRYTAIQNQREGVSVITSPYHYLPLREDLAILPGDSNQYRSAMMNLLGHFASKGYTMQVHKVNGEFVPTDVAAPFDSQGKFEFTDEERNAPRASFAPFRTALRGTREEEAQESR